MKEYDELFHNYSKLGLDEKRNKYSEEMIKIALLIKSFLNQNNLELIDLKNLLILHYNHIYFLYHLYIHPSIYLLSILIYTIYNH